MSLSNTGHFGDVRRFRLDRTPAALRIVSRSVVPALVGLNRDRRRLGVEGPLTIELHIGCLARYPREAEPARLAA